jgi:penicillin-binding protein 1A
MPVSRQHDSVTLAGLDTWTPENYDHSYGGKYSLAGALAQSMNVPTFRLYMLTGIR